MTVAQFVSPAMSNRIYAASTWLNEQLRERLPIEIVATTDPVESIMDALDIGREDVSFVECKIKQYLSRGTIRCVRVSDDPNQDVRSPASKWRVCLEWNGR